MAIHKSFISGKALQASSFVTTAQPLILFFNSFLTSASETDQVRSAVLNQAGLETHHRVEEEKHQPQPFLLHINQSILAIINITPISSIS